MKEKSQGYDQNFLAEANEKEGVSLSEMGDCLLGWGVVPGGIFGCSFLDLLSL